MDNLDLRTVCSILAMSLLALASLTCGSSKERPVDAGGPAVAVHVREIASERVPDIHEVVGTVRPRLSATLAAKVAATVDEVLVRPGDVVRTGDLLAKLDDRDLSAEFERARADHERFSRLLERQAATRAEFDAVRSRYRIAAAALSYSSITAPFDGLVTQKFCDVGDLAVPGKPLFTVEESTPFRLEANVPERFVSGVGLGEEIVVAIDATAEECSGTISEIVPAADAATRSFLIKIDLRCRELPKSGMFGRARLPVGERLGLFVPKEAVYERGQLTYLFVASEGRALMRLVKTRAGLVGTVEVLAGLQSGEQVIISSEGQLADGQRIETR
jgi:RND family efflux transporter MFP subunit